MKKLIKDYADKIAQLCGMIDADEVEKAVGLLKKSYDSGKRIFLAGNGGSAGTVNHFSCDFSKNAVKSEVKRAKVITLSSNTEYITAVGNDISFENIFVEQLKNLFEDGDLIILISASGNSPDIIAAAEYVKNHNGLVVGLSGFDGGKLPALSDVSINIPIDSYEMAEDMHMILIHMFVCAFKSYNL